MVATDYFELHNGIKAKSKACQSRKTGTGEPFLKRLFTSGKESPYDLTQFEKRDCEIKSADGKSVFVQRGVEVPADWSQMAATVVASKYFHGEPGTKQREYSIKQLIGRVVGTLCEWGSRLGYLRTLNEKEIFHDELTHILLNQNASFNSPVWFNLGNEEHPQCSACFILSLEDSMESLLELQATEGKLFKSGSGCGTNLSTIRSSREKLSGGGVPSGPLSFMRGFDAWAGSIKSGGKTRRAAKMQILNVTHPDIREFIECKGNEEKKAWALIEAGYDGSFNSSGGAYDSVSFQNANLSIRVTDEFMEAVINDNFYHTKKVIDGSNCEKLKAREVLKLAAEYTHLCGDPGIQFDTTINEWHTCPRSGRINASNPCSEYMHLDNSACNLASINLLKFLNEAGEFDIDGFLQVVDVLITAQDILIEGSRYPTPSIEECARDFRQIGLGYANLGALIMSLGLPYDSEEGRSWAACITALMTGRAYARSAELAKRCGPFRGYEKNKAPMIKVLQKHRSILVDLAVSGERKRIRKEAEKCWSEALDTGGRVGFRNSQVSVLAPTGTIGFMMDCDTTGIEPDIALVKYKKLSGGGMLKIVNGSVPRALKRLGYSASEIDAITGYIDTHDTIEGAPELKKDHLAVFDCAFKPQNGERSIGYRGHLAMMGAVQPFLSGAISKTVNVPNSATADEIFEIYVQAWRLGLKAVAVYRDGSKRVQPLGTAARTEAAKTEAPARRKLPSERNSITHKFTIGGLEGYITVGLFDDGSPGEIFLIVAKEGSTLSGMTDSFATSISLALQYGVPLTTLIRKFSYMRFEPSGFTGSKDIPTAQSIVDYVFRWLAARFLTPEERAKIGVLLPFDMNQSGTTAMANGLSSGNGAPGVELSREGSILFANQEDAPPCTRCGSALMVRQGSCYTCLNCGNQGGCS